MNAYQTLISKHQAEMDAFPLKFAFSKSQFREIMADWGLNSDSESDLKQISSLGYGGYIRKKDIPAYKEMCNRFDKELKEAIDSDKTGDGFIYDMFRYELENHEFDVTRDYYDTLDALGYTYKEVQENKVLAHALKKATSYVLRK